MRFTIFDLIKSCPFLIQWSHQNIRCFLQLLTEHGLPLRITTSTAMEMSRALYWQV